MKELTVQGMSIAPGVVETVVSIAANEVEGITAIGALTSSNIRSILSGKATPQGIDCDVDEEGNLLIGVHISVAYGTPLPEIANNVRKAVCDAVALQIGVPVASVDIYIDGIQFAQ